MKKTRRIAAMIAAMTLAATMTVPTVMMNVSAADITITNISTEQAHTFEVYQIFTGELTEGTFTNLKWGTGISKYDGTVVTSSELVPSDTIDAITALTGSDDEKARAIIAKITTSDVKACNDVVSSSGTASITGLDDGYYLVKDVTNLDDVNDANSAYIIQVAGENVSLEIKNETPTVDKLVLDETGDAESGHTNGWGESADHAINESFQFKLTATIPISDNYAAYDTYKLVFNDTMSNGVTFEEIDSVTITSTTLTGDSAVTLEKGTDYTSTAKDNTAGLSWTLTIEDVKQLVNAGEANIFGKETITVDVIYNAHLNENAVVDKGTRTNGTVDDTNYNKVDLQYSNNPDNTGTGEKDLGQTPEDYVWVFTYEVDNTKYKVSATEGNELPDAGFTLYSDSAKQNAIKLIDNKDGTYTVADPSAALTADDALATTEKPVVTQMRSDDDGIFNIKGLDAGTYYLSETDVPDGYNAAPDTTITIGAVHLENTDGTTVNLTYSGTNAANKIVDTKNNSLPSTGGMGTTLFVLGGGAAMAAAGVILIAKKRAKEENVQ